MAIRTASRRALIRACGYWQRDDVRHDERAGHAMQSHGTQAHELAQAHHDGDIAEDDGSETAQAMAAKLAPIIDSLSKGADDSHAECAMAFDPVTRTARVLGVGLPRDEAYSLMTDGETFGGTADLVLVYADRVEIADYKSTFAGGEPQDSSDQLESLAVMAAIAFDREAAAVFPIIMSEDRAYVGERRELAWLDLDKATDSLVDDLARDVRNAEPSPGDHCRARYCPAIASCPATAEATAQLVPVDALTRFRLSPVIESDAHAAWTLTALEMVREAAKIVEARVREYAAAQGGITRDDGATYGPRDVVTERPVMTDDALSLLDANDASGAVKRSASWADIDRAVGKERGRAIRETLESMGAVKVSTYEKFEWRKPKATKKGKAA